MSRWLRTKVLIIDEGTWCPAMVDSYLTVYAVSMLDGDLFDKLARIGSILRKSTKPFGGIQVCRQYLAICAVFHVSVDHRYRGFLPAPPRREGPAHLRI